MCKITGKSKLKSFTGHKAVQKIEGRYYSYWTGIEYVPGPVTGTNSPLGHANKNACFVLDKDQRYYNPDFFGKTAVFLSLREARSEVARCERHGFRMCVLRVSLSGELWRAEASGDKVIAGNHIDKIKEVS